MAASWHARASHLLRTPDAERRLLLGSTATLLIFGMFAVSSASSVRAMETSGSMWEIAFKQATFAALGILGAAAIRYTPLRLIRRLGAAVLGTSVLLLIAVLVVGHAVNGQRNWLDVGPIQVQPSEFAKLALIWWGGHIARFRPDLPPWRRMRPFLSAAGIIIFLVYLEHDLGNVLVLGAITVAVLFFAQVPLRILTGMGALAVGAVAAVLRFGPTYRDDRIAAWLHPEEHLQGLGWQYLHGTYALAAGGLFGQGPGASREKWGTLPEAHTDFILAVFGEEYGFIGTVMLLALYLMLISTILRVAAGSKDPFVRITCAGIAAWIFLQSLFNTGAVLGLLPIVGVTLPLVSYGGSSLLCTLLAIGLVARCATPEPQPHTISRPARSARKPVTVKRHSTRKPAAAGRR